MSSQESSSETPKHLRTRFAQGNYRVLHVDNKSSSEGVRINDELTASGCQADMYNAQDAKKLIGHTKRWDAAVINVASDKPPKKDYLLSERLRTKDPYLPVVITANNEHFEHFYTSGQGTSLLDRYNPSTTHQSSVELVRSQGGKGQIDYDKPMGANTPHVVDEVVQALHKQFFRVDVQRRTPVALKWGGSFFDLIVEEDHEAGVRFRDSLRSFDERHRGEYAYFVFVGGGKVNDAIKDWADSPQVSYTPGKRLAEQVSREVLSVQANNLLSLIGEDYARVIDPDAPTHTIDDAFFDETPIAIMPYAAKEVRRQCRLSLMHSDSNTLAAAAYAGADEVLFVKRVGGPGVPGVGGVYTTDPQSKHFMPGKDHKVLSVSAQELIDEQVTIDGEQYHISRTGTDGRGDHLCETHALQCMERWDSPRRIVVADPRTPDVMQRFVQDDLVRKTTDGVDYENSLSSIVRSSA